MLGADFTKAEKRKLRELAEKAYELELGEALRELRTTFAKWERGKIRAFDVSDAIHEFHNGIARELWKAYDHPLEAITVARAIREGILTEAEVPGELLAKLKKSRR